MAKLNNYISLLIFICILPNVLLSETNGECTKIKNKHAYSADKSLAGQFANECITRISGQTSYYKSRSLEQLIDYIEILEESLQNTTEATLKTVKGPKDVATLLLQRFHFDEVDLSSTRQQLEFARVRNEIDTGIIGKNGNLQSDYNFPDYIYSEDDRCNLLFMFSHYFVNGKNNENNNNNNNGRRKRRDTYKFGPSSSLSNQRASTSTNNRIMEDGVVSFRNDPKEAIAPSKVLIGILAGLTNNLKTDFHDISSKYDESTEKKELKNPILAVTLGNIPGAAVFSEDNGNTDTNLAFGLQGTWTNYGLDGQVDTEAEKRFKMGKYYTIYQNTVTPVSKIVAASRGSAAQIRGALDGYIIGNELRELSQKNMLKNIRLSTILRSYYSLPHITTGSVDFSVSYCDRASKIASESAIKEEAELYSILYQHVAEVNGNTKVSEFMSSLNSLSQDTQICGQKPTTTMDKNSKCETPSDLIFVVDPNLENLPQTSSMVNCISSRINKISSYQGHISIFLNTNSKTSYAYVPSSYPFGTILFNGTNIGQADEAFYRFRQEKQNPSAITNLGEFYENLNKTITGLEYWTTKRFTSNGDSSKNVIIIDYDMLKMPTDQKEIDRYYRFKDGLIYDNKNVEYLVIANNEKIFDDILLKNHDKEQNSHNKNYYSPVMGQNQDTLLNNLAKEIENKICDNPANLIYSKCHDKPSENEKFETYITPGYKQNWVMRPEFFLKSFHMEFKVKAIGGTIKYCWDRVFPPEKQENCKELTSGKEELFYIDDPCKKRDVYSCDPIYITIWGKTNGGICEDAACQSMDQIKFSITHKGVSCNSSGKIVVAAFLQIICFISVLLFNRF